MCMCIACAYTYVCLCVHASTPTRVQTQKTTKDQRACEGPTGWHAQVALPAAFRRYRTKCLHDAGWDALATGEIFAKVSRLVKAEEANEMRGQLYVARSPYSMFLYRHDDVPAMAGAFLVRLVRPCLPCEHRYQTAHASVLISCSSAPPCSQHRARKLMRMAARLHVLSCTHAQVVTGLNATVTTADVQGLFEPLQTRVSWADDFCAFVHVLHASQTEVSLPLT
jgi:hypothetical protein